MTLAGIFIYFITPQMVERYQSTINKVSMLQNKYENSFGKRGGRFAGLIASKKIILDQPIIGSGHYKTRKLLPLYGSIVIRDTGKKELVKVHGGFLKILVYFGLVGLSVFMIFYIYIFFSMCGSYKKKRLIHEKKLVFNVISFLVITIPMNLGSDTFFSSFFWFIMFFIIVLAEPDKFERVKYLALRNRMLLTTGLCL